METTVFSAFTLDPNPSLRGPPALKLTLLISRGACRHPWSCEPVPYDK